MSLFCLLLRTACALLVVALAATPALAAITARVTFQSHDGYVANGNPGVGHLMFFRSDTDRSDGIYDEVANNNTARLDLPGNISNAQVNLGTTPGWFTVGFNHGEAAQAMGCSTSPITFTASRRLTDGQSFDVTITCARPVAIPVVRAANIKVAGATGTNGAYRIGDTVTATWNNTAGGDNNSSVDDVTMDLSEFGGGSAVKASNMGDSWKASYILVAGNIEASGRNIKVTVTNSAGSTTTAGNGNATVDNVAPQLANAVPVGVLALGETEMEFTVTFPEPVTGVTSASFGRVSSSAETLSSSPVLNSGGGRIYSVTIPGIGGSGKVGLCTYVPSNVRDLAGNVLTRGTCDVANMVTIPVATVPVVSTPNITIAGGSGAGGAYRIGDTVTATWNNTAGGDNNTGVTSVTMDFSQFGGGAAVEASNTGGRWRASHTLVAGNIEANDRNVSATVTNAAGHTTRAGNGNATVDNAMPRIVSIVVSGLPAVTDATMAYTVIFSEAVTGVSTDDFTLIKMATAGGIAGVTGTGTTYTVNVSDISGSGTLRLDLRSSTNIVDSVGNGPPAAHSTGAVHTVAIPTVPGAPAIGEVTDVSSTSAGVAFIAGHDGGGVVSHYTVTPSPTVSGGPFVGAGSPIVVNGLNPATRYAFTVTATNQVGTSDPSAVSAPVTTKKGQVITAAPGFGINMRPGMSLVTSEMFEATSGLPVSLVSVTLAVCRVNAGGGLDLISTGPCTIDVKQAGNSIWDAAPSEAYGFTVRVDVPGAPVIGTATLTSLTTAQIRFMPSTYYSGEADREYEVTPTPLVAGGTFVGARSPIAVTGLEPGKRYTFSVLARNSAGDSLASAPSNALQSMAAQTINFTTADSYDFGTTPRLSASSDAGLPVDLSVDAGSVGVCAIRGGAMSFASVGSCTVHADQAGDATHNAATRVSQTFSVNAVVPAAPLIGAATLSAASSASVVFVAPAFDGGAAIERYEVIPSQPVAGGPFTGSGSPVAVSGLTLGQNYSFAVVAHNSAGSSQPSASSNVLSTTPLLVANAVRQDMAYGADATAIALSITGHADRVTLVSLPAHGTAVASGATITYRPNPGYAGTDGFTYSASDGYSTTPAAAVEIVVAPPSLRVTPASLPSPRASVAYTQQLTANGGSGPYRYLLSAGVLPSGLSLSDSGELSGIATESGSFTLTVAATDSSTGTGPFSASQDYTLVVAAAEVTLEQVTLPAAIGAQAYSQTLTAGGGTAPYRFDVVDGQLPAGLLLSASGEISGQPAAAGSDTFTVQVTDANGFTGIQTFTMDVANIGQAITDLATDPAAPVYIQGGAFTVGANGGASANPVVFASTVVDVCSVAGNQVTMLAAGTCVLTADQAGNGIYSAAPQQRLEVAIAMAAPSLKWLGAVNKVYGEAVFDLADPSSNSPGAFTFSSSDTSVATVSGRSVTLVGQGITTLVAMQAADGSYTGASVELVLTVSERPDPTLDAEVRGGVQAQVDASVRFARVQLGNIQARLQQVRSGDNPSSAALTLAYAGDLLGQGLSVPVKLPMNAWNGLPAGWGGWMSGTATFGNSGRQASGDFDFHTDGISLGVDRAWGDSALLGMASSIGRNRSRFDHSPSRMDADQYSLALYGLWRSGEHLFVDGALAHGWLDFDMARWSDVAGNAAAGQRDGRQTFGALTFGYQQQRDRFSLAGYGRLDGSRTRLDGYQEHGLGVYDLDYAAQTVSNSGLALGFDGSWSWRGENVGLRPFWKLEYRQSLSNSGDARINYVQQSIAGGYVMDMNSYADNMLTLGAGFDVQTRNGWLISLLFGRDQGSSNASSNSVGLRVSYGKGGGAGTDMDRYSADGITQECQGQRCRARRVQEMPRP